jgi:formylmethanofuran dehydrogenase subunit E
MKKTMNDYNWTDYGCEGCGEFKMLKKRETDGKMLCKKCSKNKSLTMEIKILK